MRRSWIQMILLLLMTAAISACGDATDSSNATVNNPANTAANTSKPDTARIESEIRQQLKSAEAAMAKNDADAFEKGTTEDYVFIGPDGRVVSRADRAKAMRSGETKLDSLAYDEITVRVHPEGSGALVVGRATVKGMNMGQKVDGAFRFTQVWTKTPDGWKSVHGQVTPIAGGQEEKKES